MGPSGLGRTSQAEAILLVAKVEGRINKLLISFLVIPKNSDSLQKSEFLETVLIKEFNFFNIHAYLMLK